MLIENDGVTPQIGADVYIAPNAVVSGDVRIGAGCRVLFGAVITADGGPVNLGEGCIVMENAVVRGRSGHACLLGDRVLVGPHSHLNGAVIGDDVFLATGVSVFPGARIGARTEVRINGVVHVNTRVVPDATVPIGWIAAGDPAEMFPPGDHEALWEVMQGLDFPGTLWGVSRAGEGATNMPAITGRYAELFGHHLRDRILD